MEGTALRDTPAWQVNHHVIDGIIVEGENTNLFLVRVMKASKSFRHCREESMGMVDRKLSERFKTEATTFSANQLYSLCRPGNDT